MGFALFFNIIAVIVSAAASIVLIIFTIALNEYYSNQNKCLPISDKCYCSYTDGSGSYDSVTCKYKDILYY